MSGPAEGRDHGAALGPAPRSGPGVLVVPALGQACARPAVCPVGVRQQLRRLVPLWRRALLQQAVGGNDDAPRPDRFPRRRQRGWSSSLCARLKKPAPCIGVPLVHDDGPDLSAVDHNLLRLPASLRRTLSRRILLPGPDRAVPDPEHRIGRGHVPAAGTPAVAPLGQVSLAAAADPARGRVESESEPHTRRAL